MDAYLTIDWVWIWAFFVLWQCLHVFREGAYANFFAFFFDITFWIFLVCLVYSILT